MHSHCKPDVVRQTACCPLYLSAVSAGFPSPAEDYKEQELNLHEYFVKNPASTFFLRACGDSMQDAGIHNGDLLVVDRSQSPTDGKIIIAALDGELMVKRFLRRKGRLILAPENPDYPEFDITESENLHIWGVVTGVIHEL